MTSFVEFMFSFGHYFCFGWADAAWVEAELAQSNCSDRFNKIIGMVSGVSVNGGHYEKARAPVKIQQQRN